MHHYGWISDRPDQRDYLYAATIEQAAALPAAVDLRPGMPPVYDQGQLGSCTANALAAAFDFDRRKQVKSYLTPSRLFIYYFERLAEGTVASDAGASLRDGIKVVKNYGVCPESEWPYVISRFTKKPGAKAIAEATKNEVLTYRRLVRNQSLMQTALADGLPFVAGITVYESFESPEVAKTGKAPMPGHNEAVLGGHAILVCGYNDAEQVWHCRNSWGSGWGNGGYFTLPYQYLLKPGLASDFWVIETVSSGA